jgi:phosphate transport system protein
MERHFDLELEKLNKRLSKMGNLVASQVHQTMSALITCDTTLAREIIDNENKIDDLDTKIDKLCQRIFALTQPVATDLRLLMSSLKINNDLERMGDHALGIAKKIDGLVDYPEIIKELHVDELAASTDLIVKDVTNILNTRDTAFVKDLFESRNMIKDQVHSITSMILEEMYNKKDVITVAANLIMILSQIERIADYSTNIAESIVFLVEGRIIKHSRKGEEPEQDQGISQPLGV